MTTPPPGRWVALAEVARPHGVKGELRLKVYNLDSDVLLGRPPLRLALADGSRRDARIRQVRRVPGAMLVELDGVRDRDAAEALRGARLEVPRDALDATDEDEWYVCDLEGCEARVAGEPFGVIRTVHSYPTCDALVIDKHAGGRVEVPLTDPYLERVDLDARIVALATVDGLEGE